ncbi:hypothetical protein [Allosphingosinicella indica]|uniref:Uncharacterized protein n=1 Tax=Allosphingosinicella indica TaxID=941907 RepID=A0A1X7GRY4_9SPHN|nr:hypothetical protein [Allosphingosinicella indica]SMF73687.1 hypothetical protein SAMN06295910_2165 [Allosphingosinicella indica]
MRVVTVLPGVTVQAVRLMRFTDLTDLIDWRFAGVLALAILTMAGREGGFSAIWTAPPPITAPPHVQAQSFARAIFTDIDAPCLLFPPAPDCPAQRRFHFGLICGQDAEVRQSSKPVNHIPPSESGF